MYSLQSKAGSATTMYHTRVKDVQTTIGDNNRGEEANFRRRTLTTGRWCVAFDALRKLL